MVGSLLRGDTTVQVVTAPIDATSIKTALDAAATALTNTVSGSYTVASFNDGRGMAILGIDNRE